MHTLLVRPSQMLQDRLRQRKWNAYMLQYRLCQRKGTARRAWLTRAIHPRSSGLSAMQRSRSCVPDRPATSSSAPAS